MGKPAGSLAASCFGATDGRYRGREVGGGRATRQPGQVRKEAALTSAVRVARQPPTFITAGEAQDTEAQDTEDPHRGGGRNSMVDDGTNQSDAGVVAQPGLALGGEPAGVSSYRVLARKYRPATFDDLIGQDAMVRTVSNAFETSRIPQAWILTGVRGVGKTTTARILARALNYELPDGSITGPTI